MPRPASKGFAHTPVARPHEAPSAPLSSSLGRSGLTDHHLALVAILAGIMWSIGAIDLSRPAPERMGLLLIGLALGAIGAIGRDVGLLSGLYAIAVGGVERLQRDLLESGSDVLPATAEAIDVLMSGRNPYDHVMTSTIPVGSPFVYPPGEFLFYLLPYRGTGDIGRVETWAGILTIAALVVAGARVGAGRAAVIAMTYAVWGIAAFRTTDGGNDVSAALLVVVSLVALAFAPLPGVRGRLAFVLSAVAMGWALAFKQFAVLVWPIVVRHIARVDGRWERYVAISGGLAAAMILPFLIWSPGAFIRQQLGALTFHDTVWGANLLNTLSQWWPVERLTGVFFVLELVVTAALVLIALRTRIWSIGTAALIAAGILVVPLLLAKWTTQSYFVYAATIAAVGLVLIDAPAEAGPDA